MVLEVFNYKMKKLKHQIDLLNIKEKLVLQKEPYIPNSSSIVDCSFGDYVEIGINNTISETSIDDFSYTSENCQIIYSEIGKFSNIASYVRLNPGQHPMNRVSQHHMQYRKSMFSFGEDDLDFFHWRREKKVIIGHDTWIGHNVVIMGGVSIGNGAVIGSSSVVTKDVPPFSIVVGNPARVIKYRFDEKTQNALEEIAWWNWSYEEIKQRLDDLKNIKQFIYKYSK